MRCTRCNGKGKVKNFTFQGCIHYKKCPTCKGYSPTREGNQPWEGQELADILNRDRGVTKAQAKAMEKGSMFGWDIPAADPDLYDEEIRFMP